MASGLAAFTTTAWTGCEATACSSWEVWRQSAQSRTWGLGQDAAWLWPGWGGIIRGRHEAGGKGENAPELPPQLPAGSTTAIKKPEASSAIKAEGGRCSAIKAEPGTPGTTRAIDAEELGAQAGLALLDAACKRDGVGVAGAESRLVGISLELEQTLAETNFTTLFHSARGKSTLDDSIPTEDTLASVLLPHATQGEPPVATSRRTVGRMALLEDALAQLRGSRSPPKQPQGWTADALFERIRALHLADEVAVTTMRKHVASGRFSVEHYVDMWDAKIRGASALLSAEDPAALSSPQPVALEPEPEPELPQAMLKSELVEAEEEAAAARVRAKEEEAARIATRKLTDEVAVLQAQNEALTFRAERAAEHTAALRQSLQEIQRRDEGGKAADAAAAARDAAGVAADAATQRELAACQAELRRRADAAAAGRRSAEQQLAGLTGEVAALERVLGEAGWLGEAPEVAERSQVEMIAAHLKRARGCAEDGWRAAGEWSTAAAELAAEGREWASERVALLAELEQYSAAMESVDDKVGKLEAACLALQRENEALATQLAEQEAFAAQQRRGLARGVRRILSPAKPP
jgi:hypothetical protein